MRASKKYLPFEVQVIQPTNFFWSSLAKYSYSVSNPLFETKSFTVPSSILQSDSHPLLMHPTVVFELVCAVCVQCRLLLATTSRLINNVPTKRSRLYPVLPRVSCDQHLVAVDLGFAVKSFLECVPTIPLPRSFHDDLGCRKMSDVVDTRNVQTTVSDELVGGHHYLLAAKGFSMVQTAR